MAIGQRVQLALQTALAATLFDAFWYAVLTCAAWLVFCLVFRTRFRERRISNKNPSHAQIRREVFHSLRAIMIFGVTTGLVIFAEHSGWTQTYRNVADYGWTWFFVSIGIMIVLHDTYFYWSHRLMHHPLLYRRVHHTHHLSTSPTPWSAYAFSPWEAVFQAGIGPVAVCLIPTHPLAFVTFMFWQIAFNVLGHCGYEIYPAWFLRTPLGKFFNTPTHHCLHHEKFTANYSLYFNVWDRLMGTNHRDYQTRFEQAATPHEPPPMAVPTPIRRAA